MPSSQNGIDYPQGDLTVETYNLAGQLTRSVDANGIATEYEHDPFHGATTQTIADFGGFNLTNESFVDEFGRTVLTLGPEHEVDGETVQHAQWTVYKSEFETWTASGYRTIEEEAFVDTLVNPIQIQRRASDGSYTESITATRGTTVESPGALVATDSFPRSTWISWSKSFTDPQGRQTASRSYVSIPASGEGTVGTNYLETIFGYDAMNRQNRSVAPDGTISRTVYNERNQLVSTWIGTNDTGATDTQPNSGSGGNNMVQLTATTFVHLISGHGQVLQQTQYINSNIWENRSTTFEYDWRNRRIVTRTGGLYIDEATLDNLGRTTISQRFREDEGGPVLHARGQSFYDTRAHQYRTKTWGVSDSGVLGNVLESNTWFDANGQVIKSSSPGSEVFNKTTYDSLGRATASYSAVYTGTGSDDPTSVAGNVVLTESRPTYNEVGQVVLSVSKDRNHDASGNGPLNGPAGSNPKSRDSYVAMWYDGIGRSIASANYGTNNNAGAPTRPSSAPASTDNVPVSETRYNIRGQVFETVDPVGSIHQTEFDDAGRVTKTIENFGGADTQTVRMGYNTVGQMSKQIAENMETGDQETIYTYGVAMTGSNSSDLASNQLLQSVTWPDGGVTSYRYNRAGEQTAVTDPNGTIHEFIYDEFGRRITDKVTTLGSGVDGGVRRVEYSYGNRERIQKMTNFDAVTGGNVQSEILYQYSDFGQIVREYQQHGDEVDTLTTPYVEYNYADGTSTTIRLLSLEYPNGRTLTYGYGTSGSLTDRTGRVSTISEGEGATTLVTYSYLGGGQLVTRHYNQPVIERSIVTGSGSNPYAALDRFGRLIDLKWIKDSKSGKVDIVRFEYGYDRVSNRLFERNTVLAGSPAVNPGVDSLFGYDQLNRLTQCETGVLNTGGTAISSPQTAQDWVLDETGNFIEFTQQNLQSGVLTTTLDQTRDHNAVNEITGIDETVGASWATPGHDNSGNMTSIPQPKALTSNFTATWDAWNRLVSLSDGSNLVAEYEYDPVNRRIVVTNYDFSTEPETVAVRHRYHTTSWQVIEERVDSSEDATQQFVWNFGYIDDLLLRDRDTNGDGSLDERLYALTDLRYSVMALANTSGTIVERFSYEAHGRSTALNADFAHRAESFYDWEYRYTGREHDLQTGVYYFRNRFYHSALGRFISRDPIGYVDGTSLYRGYFVPSALDPSGTDGILFYNMQAAKAFANQLKTNGAMHVKFYFDHKIVQLNNDPDLEICVPTGSVWVYSDYRDMDALFTFANAHKALKADPKLRMNFLFRVGILPNRFPKSYFFGDVLIEHENNKAMYHPTAASEIHERIIQNPSLVLDIGGEGRVANAVNVNISRTVNFAQPGDPHKMGAPIERLIQVFDDTTELGFKSDSVAEIWSQDTYLFGTSTKYETELPRILRAGGSIRSLGSSDVHDEYARAWSSFRISHRKPYTGPINRFRNFEDIIFQK